VLGLVAYPWRGAYNATKFALEAASDTLRLELAETGIKVILIEPGPIATDFRKNAIRQFEAWVDWENSARVEQYRKSLLDQLYKGSTASRFELLPSAVTEKLIDALESRRPKPRYFVTTPTYIANILRRLLPTRALDWVVSRG
jgi:NAD(P)-dependent dehydrogenase (short-subunit alcohol dehydrogenase family)